MVGNSVTSQMRTAMAMIQTVLHLVTSVSSPTFGKITHERFQKIDKKTPLTTIALATAGATKPGIEPMQLVSPRIVPLIDCVIEINSPSSQYMHLQSWGQCPEGW